MKFKMSTKVVSSEVHDQGVRLAVEPSQGGEQSVIDTDVVLVATGRRPLTRGLGLEELGVKVCVLPRLQGQST